MALLVCKAGAGAFRDETHPAPCSRPLNRHRLVSGRGMFTTSWPAELASVPVQSNEDGGTLGRAVLAGRTYGRGKYVCQTPPLQEKTSVRPFPHETADGEHAGCVI